MPPVSTLVGFSTPSGRELVLRAFKSLEGPVKGLTSRQIFDRTQEHCKIHPPSQEAAAEAPTIVTAPSAPSLFEYQKLPSFPVIQSLSHLKHVVLADMLERSQIRKYKVMRGMRDRNTGERVDFIHKKPPETHPSEHVFPVEEFLWFEHKATAEERRSADRLPSVRRPQEHGTGHGLVKRIKRAAKQGHFKVNRETPNDFQRRAGSPNDSFRRRENDHHSDRSHSTGDRFGLKGAHKSYGYEV